MSRLIIYDTSNFMDFPIGGQLTSIGNFLRYLAKEHSERLEELLLVGVTVRPEETGTFSAVERFGKRFQFLPVAVAQRDLGHTSRSLRLQYARGLLRHGRKLKIRKGDCNYIHTPEAYGVVKLLCPLAQCVIFSHGSYFNMERGFRFFQKNLLVKKGFVLYLKWILRNAKMIFVLDRDSLKDYEPYNSSLVKVCNSIVCPQLQEGRHLLKDGAVKELLFAGRLSRDKRLEPVIRAVEQAQDLHLTVVGDGEEYERLIPFEGEKVHFVGAVEPERVKEYMQQADVVVMNSVFEGIPMTLLEAISYGLPVVSTNVGGIGEALCFGQDSEETDGTPEGILAAIERIAASYERYSANACENSKAYDYRRVNRTVYEKLCGYWKPAVHEMTEDKRGKKKPDRG